MLVRYAFTYLIISKADGLLNGKSSLVILGVAGIINNVVKV
jgi:hypothetical protein